MANPICRVLPIAPATFHRHAAIARNPGLASDRARQDKEDFEEIRRVHDKSRGRYGARKVWHQLRRDKPVVSIQYLRSELWRLTLGKDMIVPRAGKTQSSRRRFLTQRMQGRLGWARFSGLYSHGPCDHVSRILDTLPEV